MTRKVAALNTDHRHFARILRLMSARFDAFHRGEDIDYELIRDAMFYMTQYPDRVHHPREDLVFKRLIELAPETREAVEAQLAEHEELIRSGAALHETLEQVLSDEPVPRDRVEATARGYIDLLREHMIREEAQLLPMAERLLGDADWAAIDAELDAHVDPIFGDLGEQRYRNLIDHLKLTDED